jgi:hypothetical protein
VCLYATDFASTMATFVHPMTDDAVMSALPAQPFIYDNSAAINLVAATDTITGSTTGVDESIPLSHSSYGASGWEANDLRDSHYSRVDSYKTIGAFENVTMIASYPSGSQVYETKYVDNAHMFGYSTCETFGRCTGSGMEAGSKCKGGKGYCYTSSAGTLECGRTISTSNRFGGNVQQVYKQNPGSTAWVIKPCPRGSPATNGGATGTVVTSKRLLITGCMLTADANYLPNAEIHLPQACATPNHTSAGCVFPGALNYAPGATESAFCRYRTDGCTSPTSLNYNSLATFDDGSCIERVAGCTITQDSYSLQSYAATPSLTNLDPNTPGYKGLYHDENIRWIDRHREIDHPGMQKTVTNPSSDANVLSGCIIAIEGCMEAEAANYDPKATINSQTWCVPKVEGCMDPIAVNFDPAATTQLPFPYCSYVAGCMDPVGLNYNSRATYQPTTGMFKCFYPVYGCLDPAAQNEGCSEASSTKCMGADERPLATVNNEYMCQFPPPASDAVAPDGQVLTVSVTLVVGGGAQSNLNKGKKMQDAFNAQYATDGGKYDMFMTDVATGTVYDSSKFTGRRLSGAARRMQAAEGTSTTFQREAASAAAAAAAIANVNSLGVSKNALTAVFADIPGVTVESGGVATAIFAAKRGGGMSGGAVAGLIIGILVVLLVLGGGLFMWHKKQKEGKSVTVVPA